MPARKTAVVAESLLGGSTASYIERARRALPILVQQASARQPVTYDVLATALRMPNPRNLNYVLGSIGATLEELSRRWKTDIPPIQSLVVTEATGLPGHGFDNSGQVPSEIKRASRRARRRIVDTLWAHVFHFARWPEVLAALKLAPVSTPPLPTPPALGGSGESAAHVAFKTHIASHPELLGLAASQYRASTEYRLPSGDCIDVLFTSKKEWVGVEVKSRISDALDQQRGVFQCVKYEALLQAVLTLTAPGVSHRVLLVLEAAAADPVSDTARLLGVAVRVTG